MYLPYIMLYEFYKGNKASQYFEMIKNVYVNSVNSE